MPATTQIAHAAIPSAALGGPAGPRGSSVLRLLRFERRWLVAVFETVLPVDAALGTGAAEAPLGLFVDDFLRRAPLSAVVGLRLGLWLLMLAPLARGRLRTFLGLPPADRLALLERLSRSDHYLVRESATLFKVIGCLGFCGLPSLQRRLGIFPVDATPPPWTQP